MDRCAARPARRRGCAWRSRERRSSSRKLADRLPDIPRELIDAPNLDRLLQTDAGTWSRLRAALTETLRADPPAGIPLARPSRASRSPSATTSTSSPRSSTPPTRPASSAVSSRPTGATCPWAITGARAPWSCPGTPIRRPWGQRPERDGPVFGPTRRLDVEVELGFVAGGPAQPPRRADRDRARRRAHLRLRPRQRLERARHPGLGVAPPRAVPRQVVRHLGLALGGSAGRARLTPRARPASRTRAAALPAHHARPGASTSSSPPPSSQPAPSRTRSSKPTPATCIGPRPSNSPTPPRMARSSGRATCSPRARSRGARPAARVACSS